MGPGKLWECVGGIDQLGGALTSNCCQLWDHRYISQALPGAEWATPQAGLHIDASLIQELVLLHPVLMKPWHQSSPGGLTGMLTNSGVTVGQLVTAPCSHWYWRNVWKAWKMCSSNRSVIDLSWLSTSSRLYPVGAVIHQFAPGWFFYFIFFKLHDWAFLRRIHCLMYYSKYQG